MRLWFPSTESRQHCHMAQQAQLTSCIHAPPQMSRALCIGVQMKCDPLHNQGLLIRFWRKRIHGRVKHVNGKRLSYRIVLLLINVTGVANTETKPHQTINMCVLPKQATKQLAAARVAPCTRATAPIERTSPRAILYAVDISNEAANATLDVGLASRQALSVEQWHNSEKAAEESASVPL